MIELKMTDDDRALAFLRGNEWSTGLTVGGHVFPKLPAWEQEIEAVKLLNRMHRKKLVRRSNRWKLSPRGRTKVIGWAAK